MYNSYKNPFASFNTNGMASEQISKLFTDPFEVLNKTRQDITNEKSSIIFIGSRGTGKTMLLRQFSYNVQRVSLGEHPTFLDKVSTEKYIGVYFRVDNALIKSLDSMADYVDELSSFAENIFTHYFELTIFKDYLEIVKLFIQDQRLSADDAKYKTIIEKINSLLGNENKNMLNDIDSLISYIVSQINYIWSYQSKKAIDINNSVSFEPNCGLILQGRLTDEFLNASIFDEFGLSGINMLLLIDEFESFSEKQQRILNTAMRFTKEYGVRYRIGMRPYGFKTHGTLNNEDFVKEGRDYQKVELDFPFINKAEKGQKKYVELVDEIANKRLSQIAHFSGKEIKQFLGPVEDLEQEAKDIVKGRDRHITEYLNLINKDRKAHEKPTISVSDFSNLRDANPLYEMENLLLLLRGYEVSYVEKAFNDYKNKIDSEEKDKYSNDYDKKYKLSFVFILCTIYRAERKGYYGFKCYCQMSSGIIGHFIELCRRAFEIAYFRDPDALFNGQISPSIQTEAAYECSQTEREMISRINEFGRKLETLITNIGNTFNLIHKDKSIKYPETNLFPVSGFISKDNKDLIEVACMWSLIIKKPNMQDSSASGEKQDIYLINRMFSPAFKISYRTRGGLNPVKVNDEYFTPEFDPQSVLNVKKKKTNLKTRANSNNAQISLFSLEKELNSTVLPVLGCESGPEDIMIDIDTQEDE